MSPPPRNGGAHGNHGAFRAAPFAGAHPRSKKRGAPRSRPVRSRRGPSSRGGHAARAWSGRPAPPRRRAARASSPPRCFRSERQRSPTPASSQAGVTVPLLPRPLPKSVPPPARRAHQRARRDERIGFPRAAQEKSIDHAVALRSRRPAISHPRFPRQESDARRGRGKARSRDRSRRRDRPGPRHLGQAPRSQSAPGGSVGRRQDVRRPRHRPAHRFARRCHAPRRSDHRRALALRPAFGNAHARFAVRAHRGPAQRGERRQGPRGPLFRRGARSLRARPRGRSGERAQGGAQRRRVPVHRHHHRRRVQAQHRARRRAGAPVFGRRRGGAIAGAGL